MTWAQRQPPPPGPAPAGPHVADAIRTCRHGAADMGAPVGTRRRTRTALTRPSAPRLFLWRWRRWRAAATKGWSRRWRPRRALPRLRRMRPRRAGTPVKEGPAALAEPPVALATLAVTPSDAAASDAADDGRRLVFQTTGTQRTRCQTRYFGCARRQTLSAAPAPPATTPLMGPPPVGAHRAEGQG